MPVNRPELFNCSQEPQPVNFKKDDFWRRKKQYEHSIRMFNRWKIVPSNSNHNKQPKKIPLTYYLIWLWVINISKVIISSRSFSANLIFHVRGQRVWLFGPKADACQMVRNNGFSGIVLKRQPAAVAGRLKGAVLWPSGNAHVRKNFKKKGSLKKIITY